MHMANDLHMAQLMPLPLIVSCFSKIQICLTFLVPAQPDSPGQRVVKRVHVCVCMLCNIIFSTLVFLISINIVIVSGKQNSRNNKG